MINSTPRSTLYINMAIIACEIRVRDSNTQEAVTALASSVQAMCQNNGRIYDNRNIYGNRPEFIDKLVCPCIRGGAQEAADQAEKLAAKQATPELCVIGSSGHIQLLIRRQFGARAIADVSTYLPAALDELKRRRAALP